MDTVTLTEGQTLYHEGDESDLVFFVESGDIEILKRNGADDVPLAVLGRGSILGEMGVIRNLPRSATARAKTDVRLLCVPGDNFKQAFGGENDLAMKVLRMLCDRLANANDHAAHPEPVQTGPAPELTDMLTIRLIPDSPTMERRMGTDCISVDHLPFDIGRDQGDSSSAQGLYLHAKPDSVLSSPHFRIERDITGNLVARDLKSALGTHVNGRRLSSFERFETEPVQPLVLGTNTVIAGGLWSPFRFRIVVEKKA